MLIQIKSRDGSVMHEVEANSVRAAVEIVVRERRNLSRANLYGANLSRANLYGADLSGANLSRAKNIPAIAIARTRILPAGSLIGFKKVFTPAGNGIVVLRVPDGAKRSSAFGRKCRAEYVEVIEAPKGAYTDEHGPRTEYRAGETVRPDSWDDDWQNECSHGIHFYITREEAEAH